MQRFILAVTAGLLISTSTLAAPPEWSHPGGNPGKIRPELSERINAAGDNERIRVIVSLEANMPPGKARRDAIAEAQGRVISAFKNENNGQGLGVLARYQTLFGFSASLTNGQINALSRRGDVTLIEVMPVHEKHYTESFPLTEVNQAQIEGYTGAGATIAIIDDGLDTSHAAFSEERVLGGYDFADFDSDYSNDCADQDHGTAVAGVAAGYGGGSRGVAPDADIVFLKIQSSAICGSPTLDGDVVGAIDWAVANKEEHGIDIISMSLGGGEYNSATSCDGSSSVYYNALRNAIDAGITVIAASGNNGWCDSMSRPACFSNVVSVGAVYDEAIGNVGWCISRQSCRRGQRNPGCPSGYVAYFESALADNPIVYSNSASFLDVTAPATCAVAPQTGGGTMDCFGGTSSATPFVSGIAALAVDSAGSSTITPTNMRALLRNSGDFVTDPKNGRQTPRVNGHIATLEALSYSDSGGGNQSPTASFAYSCTNLICSFNDDNSLDPDGNITDYNWSFAEGKIDNGQNVQHNFDIAGTYSVSLTVIDNGGASDTDTQQVTVSAATSNEPPTAEFTYSCINLDCDFDATGSEDTNGTIESYSWAFDGDGTAAGSKQAHSFSAANTYKVSLTVFDNEGASDSTSQSVTVTASSGSISLSVSPTKQRGRHAPMLNWSGANGSQVDIHLGTTVVETTSNDGNYQYSTRNRGAGSYTFMVCEADTSTCTDPATVVY